MYTDLYNKLSQDHRQQMQADAAMRHMAKRLPTQPRQSGLGRHVIGRIGSALVALGSRLEQIEQTGNPVLPMLSPTTTVNNNR